MGHARRAERRLRRLEQDIEQRSARIAAAWERILPFFDPLERRFLALERQEREQAEQAELQQLRARLRNEQ